jgi:hypothetical protein
LQTAREEDDMSEIAIGELEDIQALFVQSARSFTSKHGSLTLHGVSPATLYFSDRPRREVGHLSSHHFVELWGEGENNFLDDPPNAVLSFMDVESAPPEDSVVVIRAPQLDGDVLSYSIELLEGAIPASGGPCSLFIDPLGRPLSPVSLAGMRRRDRRRARRR